MIKEVYKTNTIDETIDILEAKENSMIISGGTDLIVQLRNGRLDKDVLIDISDVSELKEIVENDDFIKIGSGVTYNQIINSDIFDENLYGIKKAAMSVGSPQIRSRGTLGGNICNNSPSADLIPPLLALDAKVAIQSKNGVKIEYLRDLLIDKNKIDIEQNNLLTYIEIKKPNINQYLSFYKLGFRNALAIAKVSASVFLEIEENIFKDIKIALGAISNTAIRIEEVENNLLGKEVNDINIEEALTLLENIINGKLEGRASSEFKSYAVKGIVENAINEGLINKLRG
ncbi:MAG: FAD binding domain-containing protein [Peptostreptococcaceae bacterium]